MKKYRVLLISPVRDYDVFCGDVIYTESLIDNSPEEVTYINYIDALQNGEIFERKRVRFLFRTLKKNFIWFLSDIIAAFLIFFINILRRRKLLIANPWRHFEIIGDFDLVHVHVFPVRLTGRVPKTIISNALHIRHYLKDINGFSNIRISIMLKVEKFLCKIFKIIEVNTRFNKADRIILFSDTLKKDYLAHGANQAKVNVVPIGITAFEDNKHEFNKDEYLIGFIAKDFRAKGGWYLLDAYKQLYKEQKNIRLVIIGSSPEETEEEMNKYNIKWYDFLSRDKLLSDYFSQFDLLVYPSLFDGFPLVILEALSLGVPILVSDYFALPEMIGFGDAGKVAVSKDTKSIMTNIIEMLNRDYLQKTREDAKKLFRNKYDIALVSKQLTKVYKEVTGK